jgi:hypothetical protein
VSFSVSACAISIILCDLASSLQAGPFYTKPCILQSFCLASFALDL